MQLYKLGARETHDRLLTEPDKICVEADADVVRAQADLNAADLDLKQVVQTRRDLQKRLGELHAELKQTSEFIRQGMVRCLANDANVAWAEVDKLRARKARLLSLITHTQEILIRRADVEIMRQELEVLKLSCERREAEVAATRLKIMLSGAEARKHDPGAVVDLKTGSTEKIMQSVNRDRESVIPGEEQKLALLIEKTTQAADAVAGLYN